MSPAADNTFNQLSSTGHETFCPSWHPAADFCPLVPRVAVLEVRDQATNGTLKEIKDKLDAATRWIITALVAVTVSLLGVLGGIILKH